MEEGSSTKPLLLKEKLDNNGGECTEYDDAGDVASDFPSTITSMLLFSATIAICGAYLVGNAGKKIMEEGSSTKPLLLKEKLDNNGGECTEYDDTGDVASDFPSTITSMLLFSTTIAICGAYLVGNAMGYTSPAQSQILDELGLSLSEYSVFGSALTVGGLIGAVFSGKIADLFGRRGAMWISDAFYIPGWLLIAVAKGALSLDLGRLSIGIGTGILSYVVPVYIAEITPNKFRGAFTTLNLFMIGSGVSVTFIVGSYINWRILAVLGLVPCIIQFVGLIFIPESPRWLAKLGREREMEAALRRLRGKHIDISQEASEIIICAEKLNLIVEGGIKNLFQRKYARAVTVGIGLMVLQQLGGVNGYAYYLSFILESAGFPSTLGSEVVSVAQVVMTISCVFLIDKFGRRPLLMVSAAGMCFGSLITALSFLFKDYQLLKQVTPTMTVVGILVFKGSLCTGFGGIPWTIISEIFPTNLKGTAGSAANIVNWSGSWLISYTFNFLFVWSSAGVFFMYAIVSGLAVIFVAKMVPETKNLTLEEIQLSMAVHEEDTL